MDMKSALQFVKHRELVRPLVQGLRQLPSEPEFIKSAKRKQKLGALLRVHCIGAAYCAVASDPEHLAFLGFGKGRDGKALREPGLYWYAFSQQEIGSPLSVVALDTPVGMEGNRSGPLWVLDAVVRVEVKDGRATVPVLTLVLNGDDAPLYITPSAGAFTAGAIHGTHRRLTARPLATKKNVHSPRRPSVKDQHGQERTK